MTPTRRVFVSMPADGWLTKDQNSLKWAIVREVERLGYKTEVFEDPRAKASLAGPRNWSADRVDTVARQCDGVVLIGMPRWIFRNHGETKLPTEFGHYEGALAHTLHLPMLVLVQSDVMQRTVFDRQFSDYWAAFPADAGRTWLRGATFRAALKKWRNALRSRRDIFLGYCSKSRTTAKALKRFLTADLGATVLDWSENRPGRSVLDEIEEAGRRCGAGIFLFTADDEVEEGKSWKAVPRDNVVFEAGYFISAKGKDRVLIVRQATAKMPADLGGDIYAEFKDKSDIAPAKRTVRKWLNHL